MMPRSETLVYRLGPKRFPEISCSEMLKNPEIMASLLQDWNNLPFNIFVRTLSSGQSYKGRIYNAESLDSDLKLLCGSRSGGPPIILSFENCPDFVPEFLLNCTALKAKQSKLNQSKLKPQMDPLEDALRLAERERNEIWNKENVKRDLDYLLNFPQMPLVTSTHYQMPHKFSLFFMLFCISVREALVCNVLYAFAEWASVSELPTYENILPFFKDRSEAAPPIRAACSVIQVVRSLTASSFGLRARLLPEYFGEKRRPSFALNFAYQKLYKDCFFRNHCQCILQSMDGSLPLNKQLLDVYASIATVEKFVDGVEFPTLRLALFPLPVLANMPQGLLPGTSSPNGTLDFLYLYGLADEKPAFELPKKWAAYTKAKEPMMNFTRDLWDSNMNKLSAWMDGNGTPSFKSIGANKDFEELFSLYFGSFQQSQKYKVDTAMATVFENINLSAFEKFGKEKNSVNMDDATLIFLFSPRLFSWQKSQKKPPTFCHEFPFAQSLQKRWACSELSSKFLRTHKLIEIANKYNLN